MLGTREYTLCSPFRANAHNSSYYDAFTNDYYRTMPYHGLQLVRPKIITQNLMLTSTKIRPLFSTFAKLVTLAKIAN